MKHFQEILTTLGASQVSQPAENDNWSFWAAEYRTPVSIVRGNYLYLNYRCPLIEATQENIGKWRTLGGGGGYEVIVAPRSPLARNLEQTKSTFQGHSIKTSRQLLLDSYLKDFSPKPFQTADYYIDPDILLESGESVHEASLYLRRWMTGARTSGKSKSFGILTANGGVGKTTVARRLCDRIRTYDSTAIPILIESDQWKSLIQSTITVPALLDLAISNRIERANRLLSNEIALRVLAQERLFVVIFDGFDELCVSPACAYRPGEVIAELSDMLTPEDELGQARVLLTTRETYWNSISDEMELDKLELFRLRGFDNEQRKHYFDVRLPDQRERDLALRVSKEVGGGVYGGAFTEDLNEERPSGVPFVLDLIARYVHENPDAEINPYKADPLEGLLIDICRRENRRQRLDIDPERQLMFFEEYFRAYPDGTTFDGLKVFLQIVCSVADSGVIQRFTSHVLLIGNKKKDNYAPRYEVLRVYFIARFLAKGLADLAEKSERQKITRILAENSAGKTPVLSWLVRQLMILDKPQLAQAMYHAIRIINEEADLEIRRASSMALFHLATSLIAGTNKRERSEALFHILGAKFTNGMFVLSKHCVTGNVRGLDLSNCHFVDCKFIDSEFKNCRFGPQTKFSGCSFEGTIDFEGCESANEVELEGDCTYSKESEYALTKLKNRGIRLEVRKGFAEDAITRALKKLKAGYGFKSIRYRNHASGFGAGNPYNKKVWELLFKQKIVERHEISNVDEGGINIVDSKEVRGEVSAYLDNAVLGPRLAAVLNELIG